MLIEIADHLRDYVYDVFVTRFDFWLVFGILAQLVFGSRFILQWLASERAARLGTYCSSSMARRTASSAPASSSASSIARSAPCTTPSGARWAARRSPMPPASAMSLSSRCRARPSWPSCSAPRASAPETISVISWVMSPWRAALARRV